MDTTTANMFFLTAAGSGMGFHSVELEAPAAHAASWHVCLPRVLHRLGFTSTAALASASPLAARSLPPAAATLRQALDAATAELGDPDAHASQRMLASGPPLMRHVRL